MAIAVSTLLTRLAYRLGEDNTPGDTNENARRISYLSEAQRKVMGESYWWFANDIGSFAVVAGQENYSLEADFRDMIELRVDRDVCLPISAPELYSSYDYPPISVTPEGFTNSYFVFGDNELHLLPRPSTTPSLMTVTSLTATGGVASATISAAHGLQVNDYIIIVGANETDYNGTFRIVSVPTTTTLTYTISGTPSSPATGTITAQNANVVYRYWQQHTDFTATTSTTIIPDRFSDILVAHALQRKLSGPLEDERGSMADAIEEYNAILLDMKKENNRKKFYFKQFIPREANVL